MEEQIDTMPKKRPLRNNMVKIGGYDVSPTSEIFQENTPQRRVAPVVDKKVGFKMKGPRGGKGKGKRRPKKRSPPPEQESLIPPDDATIDALDGVVVAADIVDGVAVVAPII